MNDNNLIDELRDSNINMLLEIEAKNEEIKSLKNEIERLKKEVEKLKEEVIHVTIDRFDDEELRHRYYKMNYELYIKDWNKKNRRKK